MIIHPIAASSVILPVDQMGDLVRDPMSDSITTQVGDPQILDLAIGFALHQGPKFLAAIAILISTRWAVKRGIHLIDHLLKSLEDTLQRFLLQAFAAIIWVMGGLAALSVAGLDTTTLITALGAFGVGLSLSLQSSLSQMAAGILLVVLRPFQVGDTLESGTVRGTVDSIGLFSTTIVTADQTRIALPNNTLVGGMFKTQTATANYCLDVRVNIGDRPIQVTRDQLLTIVKSLPEVALEPIPDCYVDVIRPNLTTILLLRVWCPNGAKERVRSDLLQRIQEMFQQTALADRMA
jgi:small conductance mechanosensitive channel